MRIPWFQDPCPVSVFFWAGLELTHNPFAGKVNFCSSRWIYCLSYKLSSSSICFSGHKQREPSLRDESLVFTIFTIQNHGSCSLREGTGSSEKIMDILRWDRLSWNMDAPLTGSENVFLFFLKKRWIFLMYPPYPEQQEEPTAIQIHNSWIFIEFLRTRQKKKKSRPIN